MVGDSNIEIADVEGYGKEEDMIFSHQSLVMKSMRRCIELGNQELHEGVNREMVNNVSGKVMIVHQPDQRIMFINSIKMCKSTMICDFDEEIAKALTKLKTALDAKKKELLAEQKVVYDKLDQFQLRNMNLQVFYEKYFHPRLPFLEKYKEEEVEYYRGIFEELTNLTSRKDFYKAEEYEG